MEVVNRGMTVKTDFQKEEIDFERKWWNHFLKSSPSIMLQNIFEETIYTVDTSEAWKWVIEYCVSFIIFVY